MTGWTTTQPLRATAAVVIVALALAAAGPAAAADDERETFEAHFFLGSAIDNFAAQELQRYLNPDASGDVSTFERLVAGVGFEYRLFGKPDGGIQLWTYGLTVHGVRSADLDCKANKNLSVCQEFEEQIADPQGSFLYIVRQASSLEAHVGFRLELFQIQPGDKSSARFYINGQYGFLTVASAGDDVQDLNHVGIGVTATAGKYRGSFLEVGRGQTDLFFDNPDDRTKIIGQVVWQPEKWNDSGISGFARMIVDADFDDGSDSIQSYFGVRFNLGKLFAKSGGSS